MTALLAVRYHLTGPTAAVAIMGTVPALAGLYLAWAARSLTVVSACGRDPRRGWCGHGW